MVSLIKEYFTVSLNDNGQWYIIRQSLQRLFIVAHAGHIFGQTNAIVTNATGDVHITAVLSSTAEVSGKQYLYTWRCILLLHRFMGLSSLTTEGLPIYLWRSPTRGGTSMYSTDYCLKTCSPLSFGRISLAENNGNKRSAIITVTPGVEASGSVGSSTWHESPY